MSIVATVPFDSPITIVIKLLTNTDEILNWYHHALPCCLPNKEGSMGARKTSA